MFSPVLFVYYVKVENEFLLGKFLAKDIYDKSTGIIFFEAGEEISSETLGFNIRKNKDWFFKNYSRINDSLSSKRDLHQRLLNTYASSP